MKKYILSALLLFCCAMASVAQGNALSIKGKVNGIKNGTLYLLAQSSEEKTDTLGSCVIKKGKFKLEATIDEPKFAQLMVGGFSGGFALFVEPGVVYDAYLTDGADYYTNGAVAEIKFTTAADVDNDFTPLFYDRDNEGNLWGEIKDIQFVNDYAYEMVY